MRKTIICLLILAMVFQCQGKKVKKIEMPTILSQIEKSEVKTHPAVQYTQSPEWQALNQKQFNQADTNHDGVLSWEEYGNIYANNQYASVDAEVIYAQERYDFDGSDDFSFPEFFGLNTDSYLIVNVEQYAFIRNCLYFGICI